MDFIEENFRDAAGRLLPGHGGLKPRGASNRLQSEIKNKITEFLAGELESLQDIYSEVSAKDKLKFLSELLAYILPKSKELKIEDSTSGKTAVIDYSKLSESTLKEILQFTKIIQDENS